MKAEVVQTATPTVGTAPINYDITGATPNSDMVAALFLSGATQTDNTNTNSLRFQLGFTDLSGSFGCGQGGQNGVIGGGIRSMQSKSHCLYTPNGTGSQVDPIGAYSSTLVNGVRLAVSPTPSVARLAETLLLSGADIQAKAGNIYFASGDTSHTIAHGLGGTPDVIIIQGSIDVPNNTDEDDGKGMFIGFWDRQSTNMSGWSFYAVTAANPTNIGSMITNNSMGEILNATGRAGAAGVSVKVASVGGTNFNITFSANDAGVNCNLNWLALRGTTSQMFSKNALVSLPTSAGVANLINGMSGRPQVCIVLSTRLTTGNAYDNTDASGSMGIGISATNDYIAANTTQGATAGTFQDGVTTTNSANMISNTLGIMKQQLSGAQDVAAAVSGGGSWDTGGVTFAYSAVGASAFQAIVLAFGMPAVVSLPQFPGARTQFFTNDVVQQY